MVIIHKYGTSGSWTGSESANRERWNSGLRKWRNIEVEKVPTF